MISALRRTPAVGLVLGLGEGMLMGMTPRWPDVLEMAKLADDAGFDSIWLPDHFLTPGNATSPTVGFWECGSMLAALAASTSRITIGTTVMCTAFRNPALLAKMADTIDEISNGRLVLGLGAGWNDAEFTAFGYPTDAKFARFREAIQIIHGLLKQGHLDFEGAYYTIRECDLRPRGPRPGGLPIMIGATGPKMMRLVAQYADIWNGWLPSRPVQGRPVPGASHPSAIPALRSTLDAACVVEGRDPATLERSTGVIAVVQQNSDVPLSRFGEPISGSIDDIAEGFRGFAMEGISLLQVLVMPHSPAGIEAMVPVLERLSND